MRRTISIGLQMRISGQSILASVRPEAMQNGMDPVTFQGLNPSGEAAFGYTVPNLLIDHSMRNPHVPPGFWRGVNVNHNAIYLESFMDELAHSVGQDPLEFRRKLMANHPKHLAVLNAVADKIGWSKPAPQGVFRGICQHMGFGSYVAAATEISVDGGNKIKIHRIVAATDPGYAVNPAQIERQVAGSFVYGLSALFYGECTVKDGRMEQENFDTYNSMKNQRDAEGRGDRHAEWRVLGRCRRADDLRCRTCRPQRILRGNRQTYPHGALEEPRHHLRVTTRRRPSWPPLSHRIEFMKALRFVLLIAPTIAWLGPAVAASLPPPGAASCSGCHAVRETGIFRNSQDLRPQR